MAMDAGALTYPTARHADQSWRSRPRPDAGSARYRRCHAEDHRLGRDLANPGSVAAAQCLTDNVLSHLRRQNTAGPPIWALMAGLQNYVSPGSTRLSAGK